MKRHKFRSNKALALFLCGLLLLVSIGIAFARANKTANPYQVRDLSLTQGQSDYDLKEGINYDKSEYLLDVTDEGGFDIDTPGTYQIHYRLTPVPGATNSLPLPNPPAALENQNPGSDNPVPDGPVKPESPSQPKPDGPVKPESPSQPKPDGPAEPESPSQPKPDGPVKPESPSQPKPDGPAEPESPSQPKPDGPVKPESPSQPKPDEPVKPERPSQPKPDGPVKPESPSQPKPDGPSASANPLTENVGYEMAPENRNAIGVSLNFTLGSSQSEGLQIAKDTVRITPPSKSEKQSSVLALSQDTSKESDEQTDGSAPAPAPQGSKEPDKQTDGPAPAPTPQGSKEPDKQTNAPAPAPTPQGSKEPDKQTDGPAPAPAPQGSKEPDKQTDAPAPAPAPQGSKEPDKQTDGPAPEPQLESPGSDGSDAPASQPEPDAKPIDFSRNVVVNPAVIYQDIRMNIHSQDDLRTDMNYNHTEYELKVSDDGGFLSDRIGEYKVSYELSNISDPDHPRSIATLQRYVWITAPGADFHAPALTVDVSKDYDLFADIEYDKTKYNLSLVDPNAFDVTSYDPQRIMYRLTLKSEAKEEGITDPKDEKTNALEAAIFGREVTVEGSVNIQIDAPPLIITQGAIETVNLLEGVTATDKAGNPVKLEVVDRSQLDEGIKKAEGEAAENGGVATEENEKKNDEAKTPAVSPSPSARMDADGPPSLFSLMAQPEEISTTSAQSLKEKISTTSAQSLKDKIPTTSAQSLKDKAADSLKHPAAEPVTTEGAVIPTPPADGLSPLVTLPSNLAPGDYTILIQARADNGAYVVKSRTVTVTVTDKYVNLSGPGLSKDHPNGLEATNFSVALAKKFVDKIRTKPGTYTFVVGNGYIFTQKDSDALATQLKGFGSDYTFIITGKSGSSPVSTMTFTDYIFPKEGSMPSATGLKLPEAADSSKSAQFIIQNIKLKYGNASDATQDLCIVAQGSKLTMGEGILLYPTSAGSYVIGGYRNYNKGASDAPAIQSDVTVISGYEPGVGPNLVGYTGVAGGNFVGTTTGTTKVTISGTSTTLAINSVAGGGTGIVDTKTGTSQGKQNMKGTSKVIVTGGNIVRVLGGTRGTQTGRANQAVPDSTYVKIEGGTIGEVIGGGEPTNGAPQLVSSTVDITGGTITTVKGGAAGMMGSLAVPCNTKVTVSGDATAIKDLFGSAYGEQQFGDTNLTISGGTIANAAGAYNPGGSGTATVTLNGGKITGTLYGDNVYKAGSQTKTANLVIATGQDETIPSIIAFDNLTLDSGHTLTVTKELNNRMTNQFAGIIHFGQGSNLYLDNETVNTAGSFDVTNTTSSTLGLRRRGDDKAPLELLTAMTKDLPLGSLTLTFVGAGKENATTGDRVLYFPTSKLAPSAAFTKGFVPQFGKDLLLKGDPRVDNISVIPTSGYVFLTHTVSVTDNTSKPAAVSYYGSVAAAMKAIGTGTDDYTVTIRKDGYELTLSDGLAIASQGGNAAHITFTGQYVTTAEDVLGTGDHPGQSIGPRRVLITPENMQGNSPVISFTADTTVENLHLNYQVAGGAIYANGHKLLVNSKVEITSTAGFFPILYGGTAAQGTTSTNTHLELHGGNFSGIYGGGKNGDVTGSTTLIIDGGGLYGALYGGGDAGNVAGTTNITISGGQLLAATPDHGENLVIGGGRTGNVGACKITITGGIANGKTDVAGCDAGRVNGNVTIDIAKSVNPSQEIHLPYANIYGGGLRGGTVTGKADITLDGGTDYGVISGGGDPSYSFSAGQTAFGSVSGDKTITLLGGSQERIEMEDVVNFTTCNLGKTGTRKTSVNLKGRLDSNSSLSDTNPFGRTGKLNFYNGSVLNLGEIKKLDQSPNVSPMVGGIGVYDPGSHLHVYKPDQGPTLPIFLSEKTVNPSGALLTLGVLSDASDSGKAGDVLARFANSGGPDLKQYLSDSQSLKLVSGKDNTIAYGAQDYPTAVLEHVVQDKPDENPGDVVEKTLYFRFNGTSEIDVKNGSPLRSAYVDTSSKSAIGWRPDGPVPQGALGSITDFSTQSPQYEWSGPLKVSITEPTPTKPTYYYVHLLTSDSAVKTVVLDVDSPKCVTSRKVDRDGSGNYTFHLTVQDSPAAVPAEGGLNYTAFGLSQAAWTLGTASGPAHPEAVTAALHSPKMEENQYLHDITDISAGKFAPWEVTFHVPAAALDNIPGKLKDKVVFFFIKDKGGNTRQIAVPMSESIIAVSLPSQVGVVALRDHSNTPKVLAPTCYVKNLGTSRVKAEIVGVDFPPAQQGGLVYTERKAPDAYQSNEIDLEITQANDPIHRTGAFQSQSVKGISQTNTLLLGEMAPSDTPSSSGSQGTGDRSADSAGGISGNDPSGDLAAQPFVDFTFLAQFSPAINPTTSWSVCSLNYRFTLMPSSATSTTAGQ